MSKVISLSKEDIANPTVRAGITSMGHKFIAECGYPAEFNPEHFFAQWPKMAEANVVEIFACLSEGEPVGVLGASFFPDLFSGVMTGAELFWFVDPEARGVGRIGISLFNAFEKRCEERGCKMQVMGHISGLRGDALAALYSRRGYTPAEQMFRKVV